jgi:hypothetical protein
LVVFANFTARRVPMKEGKGPDEKGREALLVGTLTFLRRDPIEL